MGLLQPDSGLLFWMCLSFAIVFVLLAKYGFPVILRAIESRKEYIDASLEAAKEAERKLDSLRSDSQAILDATEKQRLQILHEATEAREQLLREARKKADAESSRIIGEANKQADAERKAILRDARQQVALLAVAITEKLLRTDLPDEPAQTQLAERLIDEMEQQRKNK